MRVWAVVLVAIVAAGCGDGDPTVEPSPSSPATSATPTVGPSGPTAACGLLTPYDIDAALHVTVADGVLTGEGSVTVCTFTTADTTTTVTVTRHEPIGDLLGQTLAGDPDATEFAGVGDDAVEQPHIGQITVAAEDLGIVIKVAPVPSRDALVQLARVAYARV